MANEKKTAPKKTEEKPAVEKKKAIGKWIVKHKGDGEYASYLLASNGEVLLVSEIYSSVDGALQGIETIKKNIALGNFELVQDKAKRYFYKLKSSANRLLCVGEVYSTKQSCVNSVDSVKRFAESAVLSEKIEEDLTIVAYMPNKNVDEKSPLKGKWKIVEDDDTGEFCAQLFASNGELLLSSEYVSTEKAAKTSLQNIRKNALAGNFIIDRDKNKNYVFKLRNEKKSVLCMGASYKTLAACQKAVDSTYRFCVTAVVDKL
ncbi:MAG: DUF1508 domain-containing protein [Clostridia bacterium]|nr:DUF1508 domain-containing protein [Clostridia bacterium]